MNKSVKKGRLGDTWVREELETTLGFTWTGTVEFGSGLHEMDMVFDTGSDWVVVEDIICSNCEKDPSDGKYDTSQSSTAKIVGTKVSTREYGTAKLQGTEYTDTVCLSSGTCL